MATVSITICILLFVNNKIIADLTELNYSVQANLGIWLAKSQGKTKFAINCEVLKKKKKWGGSELSS